MNTPAQCRAARGLLGWSQRDLAERASLATTTVADIEIGKRKPHTATTAVLGYTFEAAGVEFIDRGVRFREVTQ